MATRARRSLLRDEHAVHTHSLRDRRPATYAISSDSDDESEDENIDASQAYTEGDGADGDDDDENDSEDEDDDALDHEQAKAQPAPERSSAGGRSLRARASLRAPEGLKEMVNTDDALRSRRRSAKKSKKSTKKRKPVRRPEGRACGGCKDARKRCDRKKPICGGCKALGRKCVYPDVGEEDGYEAGEAEEDVGDDMTLREEIRKTLEETKKRRDAFLLKHGALFEGLLPEKNYISKLEEKKLELPDPVEYKLLEKQPEHVKATMKPYQLSGLSFLVWLYNNGSAGILGDEMGLGKTLQTLSLFSYLTTYRPNPEGHHRPFLVVCPLSVVSSWIGEAKKWVPHLRVLRFHGPASERARLKRIAETGESMGGEDPESVKGRGYDVIVTSYEVFEREKTWFRRAFVWRYVALDEGHKIKNEKTNISQALQGLSAEFRLILTGTPLQNNLTELWALLHWLFPEVFIETTSTLFTEAFDLTHGKNNLEVLDNARKLLELIMLRRMKESKGVNLGLPPKTEMVMFLPLTPMQRFWYKRLLTRLDKGLLEGVFENSKEKVAVDVKQDVSGSAVVDDKELEALGVSDDQWAETREIMEKAVKESKTDGKWRKLMNLLMQLRKCCNHPFLLPNAEPDDDDYELKASTLILASTKFMFLDKLIEELCIKQGKKVLIFSGFTKMLDVCEDFLEMKGGDGTRFKYGRLDGTTPRARRNLAIRLFNSDPSYKIMLISTRAGGLGINLASASDVVMLESDWNPQADLQAQARAHRIGQLNPVTIYRLITQGTVEEQMMGRIRKKLYLSAKVTESMRDIHTSTSSAGLTTADDDNGPALSTNQLMSLVRSGSRAIARPEIDPAEMLKWDWETTVQKCRDYADQLVKTEEAAASESLTSAEEEARWLSEMERVETHVFEGREMARSTTASSEDGPSGNSNSAIASAWSREQRRQGMNRVVMVDGHPVLKETIGNNEWEAVKTFSGHGPTIFSEPSKRKKPAIQHQDYCQVCFDGGEVHICSGCPRVYHEECLSPEFQVKLHSPIGTFYCPQHECAECEQKTTNAGGLIFRCRWCEKGYCEDCLEWDNTELIGDQILEYDLLAFPQHQQAFYVKCSQCIQFHKDDADARIMCADMVKEWDDTAKAIEMERKMLEEEEQKRVMKMKMEVPPVPELETEEPTIDGSAVTTPGSWNEDAIKKEGAKRGVRAGVKRKASTSAKSTPKPDGRKGAKALERSVKRAKSQNTIKEYLRVIDLE